MAEVKKEWFAGREEIYERFIERLKLLENHLPKGYNECSGTSEGRDLTGVRFNVVRFNVR